MSILATALLFFLITNPIGNSPTILALVKDYDFDRQRFILFREGVISLIIAIFFQYFGEFFLAALGIQTYALTLSGGFLLLLIAFSMIFHSKDEAETTKPKQEPFIVPIATPLMSGPGIMTMIMIQARQANDNFAITCAILIAYSGVIGVMIIAPYLQRLIGKRGLDALEQIMGMILALIATEMLVNGGRLFAQTL